MTWQPQPASPSPPFLKPLHTLFFFVFISAIEFSSTTSQLLSTFERTTLLNLKQQWRNPSSLTHWNATSNHCIWPEIKCNVNGSVMVLTLASKGLTGPVPSIICDLENLANLYLNDNFLTGQFPRVLYNCSKLVELELSQNAFVGTLPDDIDRFLVLKSVDFGANNFTGQIPPSIGNMTSLKRLFLYQNLFNGSIPVEIGNLVDLEGLGLAYNRFDSPEIPTEIGNLRNLTYLWLSGTNLVGKIPESLMNLTNLDHLDLSSNNLEGEIPSGLFTFKGLMFLYLFKNRLSGQIPPVIESLNLTEIDISMNKLNGSIPEGFGKLMHLEVLNLFSNQLSGDIPASISQIPSLKIFRVFRNRLTGALPAEIGLHSKLEAFEVSENELTGKLPENLCAGGTLFVVVAFSNNLTGEIPRSLESCKSLGTLQLFDNGFSGEIPLGIWTLRNLSSLRLTGNSFSGELPSRVGWNLSRLEISDNKFSGEIPAGVSSWMKLNVFKASNNLLTGEIPTEFTSLSELTVLYLDGNSLSGELPSEIKSWNSLTTLNLARNELSGPIPPVIALLHHLLDLDLSENQFSGQIPLQLAVLRLTTLNLSSNKLTGKIPFPFDNPAYENSFLNNPNLCSSSPFSNLHDCFSTPKSSHTDKFPHKIIAMIVVLSAFAALLVILVTLFISKDYLKKKHKRDLTTWKLTAFHNLKFTEANILSCLTENNLIGSGGSGKVYRIEIGQTGEYVAVKRISNNKKLDHNLEKQFLSEAQILGSIRHSNVVKLLCCISSEDSKLLVYEYMENHSLDKCLRVKRSKSTRGLVHCVVLDWPRRLKIAIGVAQGLCHMHHDYCWPIIHGDVKSSNIFLDSEFKARIADFGLAKILSKQKPGLANTLTGVAGSFGYIPPEYAYSTRINERVDVYSFGVVLLELITGKEPHKGDGDTNLAEWAWRHFLDRKWVVDAVDPEIEPSVDPYMDQIHQVFKLGLTCTSTLPSSRPSMKEALDILRRCNPLGEERKVGGQEFDVQPLLMRESCLSSYRHGGVASDDESDDDESDMFDGRS